MHKYCARNCELWERVYAMPAARAKVLERAQVYDDAIECLVSRLELEASQLLGSLSAERNAKSAFAEDHRNRTCAATSLASGTFAPFGKASLDFDWRSHEDNHTVGVRPLWLATDALPAANISLLSNFASEEECAAVIASATPRLRRATVNEEGDAAAVSLSRRAFAANVDAETADPSHPAAALWRRAFALANDLTGYDLELQGQEPFSVIHYNGSARGSTELPDEYRPHCDGGCDGAAHLHGGRVATMLVYCAAATKGGATTFTNTRTAVAPNPKDAVFFSYLDKDRAEMDTGLTQHSGCPVLEGEKWVMTLWMRKGVNQHDVWSKYDPTGAKHLA